MPRRRAATVAILILLSFFASCAKAERTSTPPRPDDVGAFPEENVRAAIVTPLRSTSTFAPPTETSLPPTETGLPSTATSGPSAPAPLLATATTTRTPPPTGPPEAPTLGNIWVRPVDSMIMVYVPAGTFQMGADAKDIDARSDEFPQHSVALDGFWIDLTEVNNGQFAAFLNDYGNSDENGQKLLEIDRGYCQIKLEDGEYRVGKAVDRPVVMVTWYGADAYCQWVGGRLPTEAEWEYAARGPEGYIYPWGDDAPNCELARYGDCVRSPIAAGSLPDGASWCGALDMAGNVWEWVADWFGPYAAGSQMNPTGPSSGGLRVQRGGGWHSPQWEIRMTFRQHDSAPNSYNG